MTYLDIFGYLPDSVYDVDADSNNYKIFSLFSSSMESLDAVFEDLRDIRDIEAQGGAVLDLIGEIVRESRAGRGDDSFRLFLMSALQKLLCTGSIESLQNVLSAVMGEYFVGVYDLTPGQESLLYQDNTVYTGGDLYLDGTVLLSGQYPEDNERAEMSPLASNLDGAFYMDGSYFLSGTVFQPGFFEIRFNSGLSEEIKSQISAITDIVKPGGVGFRLYEIPMED